VRLLMILNGLGLLAAAGYAGMVLSRAYTPWWALIGAGVFFAGVFQPLFAEYMALGSGFKELEGGYLESRRRDRGMGPAVEVLGPDQPPGRAFERKGLKGRGAVILMILGCVLLTVDVADWWSQRPPAPAKPGVISNF